MILESFHGLELICLRAIVEAFLVEVGSDGCMGEVRGLWWSICRHCLWFWLPSCRSAGVSGCKAINAGNETVISFLIRGMLVSRLDMISKI